MIDAFYQSLVCFFIPYFVSTVFVAFVSCSSPHFSLPPIFFFSTRLLLFSQAYADSDVDLFTWGTPITTIALFTILVHLGIETKTWVRKEVDVKNSFVCVVQV